MKKQEPKIDVLLVDDAELLLSGLKMTISDFPYVNRVDTCKSGNEALELLKTRSYHLVFMDYQMPGMDGAQCVKEISRKYPAIKVIGISVFEDPKHVTTMFNNGAFGYLVKTTGKAEIDLAMQAVLRGDYYFSQQVAGFLVKLAVDKLKSLPSENGPSISQREADVLKLIYEEMSSKEIATRLNLSERTVDDYRKKLLDKTGSRNVVGLVKFALDKGIVGDL